MEFSRKIIFIVIFSVLLLFIAWFYFTVGNVEVVKSNKKLVSENQKGEVPSVVDNSVENNQNSSSENLFPVYIESEVSKALVNPPSIIKGVYVTSWSALSKEYLSYLDQLFETTQINAVVIDTKDFSGTIFYNSKAQKVQEYKTFRQSSFDINGLVKHFHDKGIYVIARINVFNDVALAKARSNLAIYSKSKSNETNRILWQDSSGLYWLDPASEEVWDYNIEIAKDVLNHGFDEINFDYIRFPSDGNLEEAIYPVKSQTAARHQVIQSFFKKIRESLPDAKLSVDIFGQTTVITNGDMGVGQVLEDSFGYFDFVSPMVYPSHYTRGFLGYETPSEHPYQVVKNAMDVAKLRLKTYETALDDTKNEGNISVLSKTKIRPWLQDFTLTVKYDANKVSQEIKAVQDAMGEDFNGFMLWNPSNFYTTEAISLENQAPN